MIWVRRRVEEVSRRGRVEEVEKLRYEFGCGFLVFRFVVEELVLCGFISIFGVVFGLSGKETRLGGFYIRVGEFNG